MSKTRQLIERAISKLGSEQKLAAAAGLSQAAVNEAKKFGRCGPKMAIGIERATEGEISRAQLRPDLWD